MAFEDINKIISNLEEAPVTEYTPYETIKDSSELIYPKVADEIDNGPYEELSKTLTDLVTEFNKTYEVNLDLSSDNISDIFKKIIKSSDFNSFKVLISEIYSRFEASLQLKLMQSIMILSNHIFDPKRFLAKSITYPEQFAILEKMFEYMNRVQTLGESVKLGNPEELMRANKERTKEDELDNAKIRDIIDKLK